MQATKCAHKYTKAGFEAVYGAMQLARKTSSGRGAAELASYLGGLGGAVCDK